METKRNKETMIRIADRFGEKKHNLSKKKEIKLRGKLKPLDALEEMLADFLRSPLTHKGWKIL